MQLAATDEERRNIGGSLSDALSYFDEAAPFVKLLNVLGPWSGVIDGLASAIYDRAIYISQHRVTPAAPAIDRRPAQRPPAPPPGFNGRAPLAEDDEIVAPNPGAR